MTSKLVSVGIGKFHIQFHWNRPTNAHPSCSGMITIYTPQRHD